MTGTRRQVARFDEFPGDVRPIEADQKVTLEPDYYEPYAISQGIKVDNLVFLSGQAGIDEDGRTVPGGFEAQARQAFANVARALEAAGSSLSDVVKVSILVTDMGRLRRPDPVCGM